MASEITSTTRLERRTRAFESTLRSRLGRRAAFTLPEIIIGATISSIVLAGVLSTFLMLGRSGTSIVNYTTMDVQMRRALEEFAQDVRMASGLTTNSSTSITLTVPDNYGSTGNQVTYAWDSSTSGATSKCFYRMPGNAAANNAKTIFIRNVSSFAYSRYDRLNNPATQDSATKRVQMAITATSNSQTVATARDDVVSASFILRNKLSS